MSGEQEGAENTLIINHMIPSPEATAALAESVARRLHVVPLAIRTDGERQTLVVACEGAMHKTLEERLARHVLEGTVVQVLRCPVGDIPAALDRCYSLGDTGTHLLSQCQSQTVTQDLMRNQADVIVRLLDDILLSACRQEASDIHLSPQGQALHIRLRVDGVLRHLATLSKAVCSGLLVRIKILASMDIAETRRPQDGQFRQLIDAHDIDFRVSCFPTVTGQNTVLRILDRKCRLDRIAHLNLPADVHDCLLDLVERPDGLLLVCGPTGSGKSTTLHALLNARDAASLNIMTLEDPVERFNEDIRQSSIDATSVMDFSQGVRALLRQDPDVLLIGEIRDTPSCAMALRAVMSGHQVMTTVHARSALAGLSRLRELGALPSILANNLVAVAAQRLVRKRCQHCHAEGCPECLGTGYLGRQLLLELLVVSPKLAALIAADTTHQKLLDCALMDGFMELREQGQRLVEQGVTTPEELDRVLGRAL